MGRASSPRAIRSFDDNNNNNDDDADHHNHLNHHNLNHNNHNNHPNNNNNNNNNNQSTCSAIVHLANSVHVPVGVDEELQSRGISERTIWERVAHAARARTWRR